MAMRDPFVSPYVAKQLELAGTQRANARLRQRIIDLEKGNARLRQQLEQRPVLSGADVSTLYAVRTRIWNAMNEKATATGEPTWSRLNEYYMALNKAFRALEI